MTTYRYYLPSFVGASAGYSRKARRVVCQECTRIYGANYSTDDGCPRYAATVDSNGQRYCANCGHVEYVHP